MIFFLLACAAHKSPHTGDDSRDSPPQTQRILYVSSYFGGAVHRYDAETGEPLEPIAGVPGAQTVVMHEGQLVIVAEQSNAVLLADPATGAITGTLIGDDPDTAGDETGGLSGPTAAVFGPDGRWYVASFNGDSVLRYGADGAFVDVFVPPGTDGLDGPDIGMMFDPAGQLLVPGYESNAVHVYDASGQPQPQLFTQADGAIKPRGIAIHEDGRVFVACRGAGMIAVRGADGVSSLSVGARPAGLALHEGALYVSFESDNSVRLLDPDSGAELEVRVEDPAIDGVTTVAVW